WITGSIKSLLWIIFLCSSGVCARRQRADADESWSESVSRARCASRCLSLHSVASRLQNNGSLGWCHNHKQCAKVGDRVFPRKHWECVTSCEFLHSVLMVKQGSCPPPQRASGAPLKPRKELAFEEVSSGQLEVHWSSRFNISAEPVVYVLQRRWNFGIQPSEDTATSWQVAAQTTEQRARLSDIRPGRWYQFRVAAVNLHGTRGFTTPSRHFHSNTDPSNPPAPTELRVANMSFGPGSTVGARIEWSMPPDLDVPIHHYKVSWSWTAVGHSSASSLTKRRKTVRKSQVELDGMRTNRSYSVEVQAVSYWGQTQFKGPRAVLHFTTQQSTETRHRGFFSTSAPRSPAGDVLDVGTPFYQDGQLRVHVYWQRSVDPLVEFYRIQWGPEYCGHNQTSPVEETSTKESFISLQGLLFSCKYKVLLQPVSKTSHPLAESTSFHTPPCTTIQAKSPTPVNCPRETGEANKVLVKPTNLIASFEVLGGNVTAIFSWDISMTSSHQQLTGYQVTWAEVISTNRNYNVKLPRTLISQSQILPPVSEVTLLNYTMELITAGTEAGKGKKSPSVTLPFAYSRPLVRHHVRRRTTELCFIGLPPGNPRNPNTLNVMANAEYPQL
uniref:Anosmin 1a n=1 Tax=Haplochromis burtoni TaxID=8153 RepID=A0A3Q2WAJ6_HAPBU